MTLARPSQLVNFATSGTRTEPSSGLITSGYGSSDIPAAENFNYVFGVLGDWHQYLDQERAAMVTRADAKDLALSQLAETQAVQSLRQVHVQSGTIMRDAVARMNALGSMAGWIACGDGGKFVSKVGVSAPTQYSAGSSYTGGFASCCSTANGTVVMCGSGGEIQTTADGISATRRNNTGANLVCCAADGSGNVLAGGIGGVLWKSTNNGTAWASATSPDAGVDIRALHWVGGLWVMCTATKIYTSSDASSWTLRFTASGTYVSYTTRLSHGAMGWQTWMRDSSNNLIQVYSTNGTTWTASSAAASANFGDYVNTMGSIVDQTFIVCDLPAAGTENLSVSVFKDLTLSPSPNGNCQTIQHVLTSKCRQTRLKVMNNQIWYLGSDGTDGYLFVSAPFK